MQGGFPDDFIAQCDEVFGPVGQLPAHSAITQNSPFPCLAVPDKKIIFHLISLRTLFLTQRPRVFFATWANTMQQQGWQPIQVWEDVWHNRRENVIALLVSLAGKSQKIFARNTIAKRINKTEADAFLNQYHLGGSPSARFKYGLFMKKTGQLVAVATFSPPRTFYRDGIPVRSYELIRYGGIGGANITGGLSKLLQAFIADVQPGDIMTYADRDWWTGNSYLPLGFKFIENTQPHTFFVRPNEWIRYPAGKIPPPLVTNYENLKNVSPTEFLRQNGYIEVENSGNRKFLLEVYKN